MNTFEFKCTDISGVEVNMKFKGETLDEVTANFEMFLRGCGYEVHREEEEDLHDYNIDYCKEVSGWFKSFGEPKDNIILGEFK